MKQTPEYLAQRLETCRKLFFEYNGREHARIEREMRAGGFPDFNRRCLYARGINSGWIERHGWDRELMIRDFKFQIPDSHCKDSETRGDQPAGEASGIFVAQGGAERNPGNSRPHDPGHRTSDEASSMAESSRRDAETQSQDRVREQLTDWTAGVPACNAGSSSVARTRRRRQAKNRSLNEFHRWLKKVSPPMFDWDAKHLKLLIKTLQLVTEGKIKRLMIFMPPRHGKSELVTIRYTAWRLLKDPTLKVILASYAQALANRFSRNIRNTLAEHVYQERSATDEGGKTQDLQRRDAETQRSKQKAPLLTKEGSGDSRGVVLSERDQQRANDNEPLSNPFRANIINSAKEWETGKGGGVKAVGVGGGITGYGAKLMMIDDPIKSREQAESQSYRDKVWHWFNDDMMTRLEPDAGVVLIQTRWHEDDLAGRLLKQQQQDGTDEWHVISLPAIAETVDSGQWTVASAGSGSPPYAAESTGSSFVPERGVDAASADGVVLSRGADEKRSPIEPAKLMPARHLAFTTMPPYIEGKSYGDIVREREEAKRVSSPTVREGALSTENTQAELTTDRRPLTTLPDPLNRRPGEALWPQRFDIKQLEKIKRRMGTYSFEALYQQKPVPTEGGLFKRSWFANNIVQTPPPNLNWKRGYDLSFTANPESDPSATLKVAYDKDGVLYIDGCFTGRLTYPLQRKMLLHYIKTETRTEHGIELSANGHALLQDLRRMPKLYGRKFRGVKVDSSKLTRALPWIALAEEGRVRLVAGRWNEDFIQEACSFPHGHHDDQIDAVSIAIAMHGKVQRNRFWRF